MSRRANFSKIGNCVADYNMDNDTICNDGGHIISESSMMQLIMDVEDDNNEVAACYIK